MRYLSVRGIDATKTFLINGEAADEAVIIRKFQHQGYTCSYIEIERRKSPTI